MRARELTGTQQEWLHVRAHLERHRHRLSALAAERYGRIAKVADTVLLTAPEWLPDEPVPLQAVDLTWTPDPPRAGLFPSDAVTEHLRPAMPDGSRHPSYSAALASLAAPAVFRNRTTYRLRAARLRGRPRMDFEPGRYFDGIDVGEACAHELAAYDLGLIPATPLRDAVGDPCDPDRRPVNVAVAALTLRHDRSTGEASFPLHWRDPARVGHAGGTYMVIPAGIFQATTDDPGAQSADLSLFGCLAREYGEELLGVPEPVGGTGGAGPLAPRLDAAARRGDAAFRVVGMGTDPLTLATDLLVVATFAAAAFDDLFGAAVGSNSEGRVVGAAAAGRFPFTGGEIERLLRLGQLQTAGEAALCLAGRFSADLLRPPAPADL